MAHKWDNDRLVKVRACVRTRASGRGRKFERQSARRAGRRASGRGLLSATAHLGPRPQSNSYHPDCSWRPHTHTIAMTITATNTHTHTHHKHAQAQTLFVPVTRKRRLGTTAGPSGSRTIKCQKEGPKSSVPADGAQKRRPSHLHPDVIMIRWSSGGLCERAKFDK